MFSLFEVIGQLSEVYFLKLVNRFQSNSNENLYYYATKLGHQFPPYFTLLGNRLGKILISRPSIL